MARTVLSTVLGLAAWGWLFAAGAPAEAQNLGCRMTDSASGPSRQVLHCDAGPVIEAEIAADASVVDRAGKGKPDAVKISTGAALIEVPQHYPGGFQILTPRAVASVRGTVWVVDVQPERTSVFVVRGKVAVRRTAAKQGVVLGKGEGVDVDAGAAPLRVERWAPARAAALLARFGR